MAASHRTGAAGIPATETISQRGNYALTDQIRRAVVSIPANIAEGHARQHTKEFLQYLAIARGSLAELDTLFVLAEKLGYVTNLEAEPIQISIRDLRMMLHGLTKSLQTTESRADP